MAVEPVDPYQCDGLRSFEGPPCPPVDDLDLVKTVESFRQGRDCPDHPDAGGPS